jgi:hypothetical protein
MRLRWATRKHGTAPRFRQQIPSLRLWTRIGCPGRRGGELDAADAAKLWALVSDLPGSQLTPRSQLIRLTGVLPADLAARLLRLLDGGPELVGAQAARIRTAIDPNEPATPALAVVVLGWLEAAQRVLATGSSPQELQVLLSVADHHGQPP